MASWLPYFNAPWRDPETMDLRIALLNKLNAEHVGERNAATQKVLAAAFRVNIEQVRDAVRSLRRDGYLIASTCKSPFGYFIPTSDEEVERYITQLESRIDEEARTLEVQREAAKARFPNVRIERTFVISHPDHERQLERMIPVPEQATTQVQAVHGAAAGNQERQHARPDSPCEPGFIPPHIIERFKNKFGWVFDRSEIDEGEEGDDNEHRQNQSDVRAAGGDSTSTQQCGESLQSGNSAYKSAI